MELLPLSLCLLTLTGPAFSEGPETMKVTEGDDVTLPCLTKEDISSHRFEWMKDGKKLVFVYETTQLPGEDDQFRGRVSHQSDDKLTKGDASITITGTKVADSGLYTCDLPKLQQTFTIRLVVAPKTIKVKEGDDVTLPCLTNKDISSDRFEWMKDGEKDVYLYEGTALSGQDEEFRGRVSHFEDKLNNGDASITITGTKVADTGLYTCNFPKLQPKQTFTVRLLVGGDLKDRRGEIHGACSKPSIRRTEDGMLQCEVSGASPDLNLNMSWFNSRGTKLTDKLTTTDKTVKTYVLNTTVTKSDTYRCVATMEEISHQVQSEIYVPYSKLTVGLMVGGLVAAIIIAVLVLFLRWKKIRKQSPVSYVHIERGVMFMEEKPVNPGTVMVPEGSDAALPCRIKKNILSEQFVWKKYQTVVYQHRRDEREPLQGQHEEFKGRVYHQSDDKLENGDASITITKTTTADTGLYTCNFPDLQQTFTVCLLVGPRIIKVKTGSEVTLPCSINKDISSERFDWWKDGKKLDYLCERGRLSDQDEEFRGRVSCQTDEELKKGDASITIRNTTVDDTGLYICDFPDLQPKQTFTVYLVVGGYHRRASSAPYYSRVTDLLPLRGRT